ncbi:hypothetical protein ACFXJ6_42280, partial [Streptomyces sp. NPDC059218]|uniref:hypothetical protein n=1 Tax=Streptomyces sp. NPDC059218 TaxID=3346773 RepID=UPI00368AD475
MPHHKSTESRLKRCHIQRTPDPHSTTGVVLGPLRIDLRGKPDPSLRERQRHNPTTPHRHQTHPTGNLITNLIDSHPGRSGNTLRGTTVEQHPHRNHHTRTTQPRHNLNRTNG